jgi:hypothetical protein
VACIDWSRFNGKRVKHRVRGDHRKPLVGGNGYSAGGRRGVDELYGVVVTDETND